MEKQEKIIGYLPDERPTLFKLVLFAFQQIIVMFPATVLVALLTGFHVSTTIFASGLATLCFILITKRKIPLYYGSSFSYIAAICSITTAEAWTNGVASNNLIGQAQFGIILSGLVSIAVGLIVRKVSMEKIEKILPPSVTGPMAIIIGLSLAGSALTNITGIAEPSMQSWAWVIGIVTFLATVLFSIYVKRGTWGQIPILLGLLVGYVLSLVLGWIVDYDFVNFSLYTGTIFSLPHFTLPVPSWTAVLAIMPIAIATIPESTAHLFQLDIYVNKLAEEKGGTKKYDIANRLGDNLIGDGIGDMISGLIGGPAGTNYGENISTMSITKNFSVVVLMAAAIITMIISMFVPISAAVYSIPGAVIGGLSVYLFGVIAAQGVAIMIEKKVSLFSAKNLAVIASILIIGIGGSYAFPGGMIPMFGLKAPAIATAAIVGIVLNLIFVVIDKIIASVKK
ncbi:MAG TPA: xanthine permease [Acholeplasmatales bacterium]|nr:xanthine permease [Acholeplasmatales bacterium]